MYPTTERTTILMALAVITAAGVLLWMSPRIHQWERDQGYPWGQMCKSIFTLWEDTCPRTKDQFSWVWAK